MVPHLGLVAGWVVGLGWAMYLLYQIPNAATGKAHFGGSALALGKLSLFGWHPFEGSQLQIYVGVVALAANLIIGIVITLIMRQIKMYNGTDQTSPDDYHADEGSPKLREVAAA